MPIVLDGTTGITYPSGAVSASGITYASGLTGATPSIGDGQTWQTVTGSRAASTTYTNTTGRPIFVSVGCQNSGGAVLTINGIQAGQGASTTSVTAGGVCGVVPTGGTYSFSGTIYAFWAELR